MYPRLRFPRATSPTRSGLRGKGVAGPAFQITGSYAYGEDGDYKFDEGLDNLRKRCIRRLVTRKNGFAWLPDYGVGAVDEVKRLNTAVVRQRLAAEAERQFLQEPEVVAASVKVVSPQPGLVIFRCLVRASDGSGLKFEAPFEVG